MRYSKGVHRAVWRTVVAIGGLLAFLLCACADRKSTESHTPQLELSRTLTPFAASEVIARLPIRTCTEFASVIAALSELTGRDAFASVSIEALVRQALSSARPVCDREAVRETILAGGGAAQTLALSWVADNEPAALAVLKGADEDKSALLLRRRGQILVGQGKTKLALESLLAALALEEETGLRSQVAQLTLRSGDNEAALSLCAGQEAPDCWTVELIALAQLGKRSLLRKRFEVIPLHLKADMAERVLREAKDVEGLVAAADTPAEWLVAAARFRFIEDLATKATLLDRAVLLMPSDAEIYEDLAETREALGQSAEAVAAWDRSTAVSLGNTRARLAAIRILAQSGQEEEALARSALIAKEATEAEGFHLASLAYKYAGDRGKAVLWAERAYKDRPGNGRYVSDLASRLHEAGEQKGAIALLRKLLVCGVSGKAWHRHEIAAQLQKMQGLAAMSLASGAYGCVPVEAAELSEYVESSATP